MEMLLVFFQKIRGGWRGTSLPRWRLRETSVHGGFLIQVTTFHTTNTSAFFFALNTFHSFEENSASLRFN